MRWDETSWVSAEIGLFRGRELPQKIYRRESMRPLKHNPPGDGTQLESDRVGKIRGSRFYFVRISLIAMTLASASSWPLRK